MDAPEKFDRIVDGMLYSVESATLIADDCFWDGNNFERSGRNCFLYRTENGRYFTVTRSQWQGEFDSLAPVSPEDAQSMYEDALPEHYVDYADAFPNVKIVAA